MNEGFMLASKVIKRQITLEEGVVSAVARDQLANFANSFNAIMGRNVLSRYQCDAMVSKRSFPTLDQLLESSELQAVEGGTNVDLEELYPASSATPATPADSTAPAAAEGEAPPAKGEAPLAEGEAPPVEGQAPPPEGETPPEGEAAPFQMLDLNAVESLLKPRIEELEKLKDSREDLQHAITRMEWFDSNRKPDDALPPGLISFAFLFVLVLVCVFLFVQDRTKLAFAILIPVIFLDGLLFYYEISAARERTREQQRQHEKRQREIHERRERLAEMDQQIEAKLKEIETLKAQLRIG